MSCAMHRYFSVSGVGRQSRERKFEGENVRLFCERPCGVARQNVIGDTYGAQTYAGRYAYIGA